MSMPYIDDDIEVDEEETTLLENFEIEGNDLKLSDDDIVLSDGNPIKISGYDALKQWIGKALLTRAYIYPIYNMAETQADDEDTEPEHVYGSACKEIMLDPDMDYAEKTAEIQEDIEEVLALNPNILSVSDFTFERQGRNLTVGFTVSTVYGEDYEEVMISGENSE